MDTSDEKIDHENVKLDVDRSTSVVTETGEIVNASGHRDQLKRQYGLLSICGLALTIDNAWVALGGSIAVSISPYKVVSARATRLMHVMQAMADRLVSSMNFSSHVSTTPSSLRLLRK